MKVIVTGSLGHIGQPLTQMLVQNHHVTVISSSPERVENIETLGAQAAIGSLEDVDFIIKTFSNADLAYCMIPPNDYFNQELDLLNYYKKVANNYAVAIRETGIKQVIYLSTIGGHLPAGNGILAGHYYGEQIMQALPTDVHLSILRPTEFYYNLLGQIHTIRSQGVMASVCGGEVVNVWVAPTDIAAVIAEEIEAGISGRTIRYIASEEITYNELAKEIGAAIGKPDLAWVQITSEQLESGLVAAGLQPKIAAGLVEMYEAINTGLLYEDYQKNKPAAFGKVKVKDFAKAFAAAYQA